MHIGPAQTVTHSLHVLLQLKATGPVYWHNTKKPVTTMLTYPWKCTVLHCNHLGNTWKPLVLMIRHFDCCPSASEGDNQSVRSSSPVVSRCFPGGYNVKLYISRGRLAWWLLAFLHSVKATGPVYRPTRRHLECTDIHQGRVFLLYGIFLYLVLINNNNYSLFYEIYWNKWFWITAKNLISWSFHHYQLSPMKMFLTNEQTDKQTKISKHVTSF